MTANDLRHKARYTFKRRQRQFEGLSVVAEKNIDRHFVNRLARLLKVKRFVITWTLLIVLLTGVVIIQIEGLSGYYQTLQPIPGGVYYEGILGDFTSANPLFASGSVDSAISKLLFASLFTYNNNNQLIGDLASGYSVNANGKIYTVNLKPNLTWQDGTPITARDVVFTYQSIQNPNIQSPLYSSWQGVSVASPNPLTITFTLQNSLSSFPYSLTNGIIPEHLLANIPAAEMISASFNTNPIGSGPFSWGSLLVKGLTPQTRQEQITLKPFTKYVGGEPKLSSFVIRAFHDQGQLILGFQKGEFTGLAGLQNIPNSLLKDSSLNVYSMQLTAANMVFFNTSSGLLSDSAIRKAIVSASDPNSIINQLGYPVSPLREPLLNNQLGFNSAYVQQTANLANANGLLTQDGWVSKKPGGTRYKNGLPLQFKLYAANTADNQKVTSLLHKQLSEAGIDMQVILQDAVDLSDTLTYHQYDALLYGISIGVDPDVFAYWDSTQAFPSSLTGLNLSDYKSATADEGLEAGRIVKDPALRAVKYSIFLKAWQSDAPALALYQPRFLYLTNQLVYGLSNGVINQATGRYDNVQNWEIRQAKVADQ